MSPWEWWATEKEREPGTLQVWVTFVTSRRVPVEAAAALVKDYPHVTRGTFAAGAAARMAGH